MPDSSSPTQTYPYLKFSALSEHCSKQGIVRYHPRVLRFRIFAARTQQNELKPGHLVRLSFSIFYVLSLLWSGLIYVKKSVHKGGDGNSSSPPAKKRFLFTAEPAHSLVWLWQHIYWLARCLVRLLGWIHPSHIIAIRTR